MADEVGIALLGHGVVGRGVLAILEGQADLIARRTGRRFVARQVVVRDPSKHDRPATTDLDAAVDDPDVQVVIELIGGVEQAGAAVRRALSAGKHVVTANKSLIAAHGRELAQLAAGNDVTLAFEASCGGGIPIVASMQQSLVGNGFDALVGILNGTCNFILSQMTQAGMEYDAAVAEAQRLGFAEADPTLDVTGRDAAQKLAILSSLAFDADVREEDVRVEGVAGLDVRDIELAGELGRVVKLLGVAVTTRGGLALRVAPYLVEEKTVLADMDGPFNAIGVWGDALGHALFYGRGAGQMPTASAVVADLAAVALGVPAATQRLAAAAERAAVADPLQQRTRAYLRVIAANRPGVLGRVCDLLGEHGISIASVNQPEADLPTVPIVITTHACTEGDLDRATAAIDALDAVDGPCVRLRLFDPPAERDV